MRQLDPRVSIVNGHKTGNVLGREPIGRPWGAVKARRIYGWDTAQRPCMRRKMTRHMNEKRRQNVVCRKYVAIPSR